MSLRDLNWHKSLFRLWVVMSFIWIAAFAIFAVYPAAEQLSSITRLYEGWESELKVQTKTYTQMTEVLIRANTQNKKEPTEENRQVAETLSEALHQVGAFETQIREKDIALIDAEKKAKEKLAFYSEVAAVPPIMALILGAGAIWAFSGFAKKQSE